MGIFKKEINQIFAIIFLLPSLLSFELLGAFFLFRSIDRKKIIFPRSLLVFLSSKENSKNHDKNSTHRYLPEISFVLQRDNNSLGVNVHGVLIGLMHLMETKRTILQSWSQKLCCLKFLESMGVYIQIITIENNF